MRSWDLSVEHFTLVNVLPKYLGKNLPGLQILSLKCRIFNVPVWQTKTECFAIEWVDDLLSVCRPELLTLSSPEVTQPGTNTSGKTGAVSKGHWCGLKGLVWKLIWIITAFFKKYSFCDACHDVLFVRFEQDALIIMRMDGFLNCSAVQLSLRS